MNLTKRIGKLANDDNSSIDPLDQDIFLETSGDILSRKTPWYNEFYKDCEIIPKELYGLVKYFKERIVNRHKNK